LAFLPPFWAIRRDAAAASYLNVERYSDVPKRVLRVSLGDVRSLIT